MFGKEDCFQMIVSMCLADIIVQFDIQHMFFADSSVIDAEFAFSGKPADSCIDLSVRLAGRFLDFVVVPFPVFALKQPPDDTCAFSDTLYIHKLLF